jgi:hypothetical protein
MSDSDLEATLLAMNFKLLNIGGKHWLQYPANYGGQRYSCEDLGPLAAAQAILDDQAPRALLGNPLKQPGFARPGSRPRGYSRHLVKTRLRASWRFRLASSDHLGLSNLILRVIRPSAVLLLKIHGFQFCQQF